VEKNECQWGSICASDWWQHVDAPMMPDIPAGRDHQTTTIVGGFDEESEGPERVEPFAVQRLGP
jgi:hypothetical protein